MGRLGGLLNAGIGLAMEVAQSRGTDPRATLNPRDQSPRLLRPSSFSGNGLDPRDYQAPRRDGRGARPISAGYDDRNTRRDLDRAAPYGNEVDENSSPPEEYPPPYTERALDERPMANLSPTRPSASFGNRLPYPVIIPQRRPENRSRGWLMAYAPVLEDFGIDQTAFLKFLHDFNQSSEASPYLDAVNLAAFGVGFAPGIAPIVVSMAVPVAVQFAKKTQTDRQTNSYLGRMNRDFFEPRGLFAVVMTMKPGQPRSVTVDSNSDSAAIVGRGRMASGGYAGGSRYEDTYRASAPAPEIPECAPLVFPPVREIDEVRPRSNRLQEMNNLAADYFDRRAQAQYMQRNPNSSLPMEDVRFKSAWGDPRNGNQDAGLIGILSGGRISRQNKKQEKRDRKDREKDGKREGGLLKSVKAKASINKDILYLMITEKPSEEAMRTAPPTPLRLPVRASERNDYAIQHGPYSVQQDPYSIEQDPYGPVQPQYPSMQETYSQPGPPEGNWYESGNRLDNADHSRCAQRSPRPNNPYYCDKKG